MLDLTSLFAKTIQWEMRFWIADFGLMIDDG